MQTSARQGNLPTLGPIYKLPNEVLAEIFIFLKIMFPCFSYDSYPWSPILLVNRQWHSVAINCSFLWTELEISQNIPNSYLERSRAQPLSLHWLNADSGSINGVSLDRYSAYFPRARRLVLSGMAQDNGVQAFDGITSLPLLEDLTLYPSNLNPLPEIFASGHFPKLTSLTFCLLWSFQWRYTIFSPNLRHLFIHGVVEIQPLTSAELLDGLRNMPLLERLELLHIIPEMEEPLDLTSVVALRRLKRLSLCGSVEECTAFLKSLTFPPSANIDIHCVLLVDDDGNVLVTEGAVTKLSEALRDKIVSRDDAGSLLPPMKYLLAQQYEHLDQATGVASGTARLRCMRDDRPFGDSTLKNLLFFEQVRCERYLMSREGFLDDIQGVQVVLSWDLTENMVFEPLPIWPAEICRFIPFDQVTTVALDLKWYTSLMGLGRMCPNVTTVLGRDDHDTEGLSGLHYLLEMDEDHNRHNRLDFPKLKTLVVDRVEFWHPGNVCQELDLMHATLLGLPATERSMLERIYFATQDVCATSLIAHDHHARLKALKADFPLVDIAMIDYTKSESLE